MELELTLGQKQVFSQNMQLSLRILQMNTLELEQFLRDAAVENPVIEPELFGDTGTLEISRAEKPERTNDPDSDNSFIRVAKDGGSDHNTPLYRHRRGECASLRDELLQQLSDFRISPELERLVRLLIESLDDNGYLTVRRERLISGYGIDEKRIDEALSIIHRMDPPGVGARDLRECLLIQARRLGQSSPVLDAIIRSHLDLIAKNQLSGLAKILRVSLDEVKEARLTLLSFNPKPGNGYSKGEETCFVRPDLTVVRFEHGYQAILNDYCLPKLEINSYYRELAKTADRETASYLKSKLNQANHLSACIVQRQRTILACANVILARQKRFFDHGPGNIAPLCLLDAASEIKQHISTVSRAVSGKYLQCQWGVYKMGHFFNRSVGGNSNNLSQESVQKIIADIIAGENAQKPYSDQNISDVLARRNIEISRRTVAKYRDRLGIPASSRRME